MWCGLAEEDHQSPTGIGLIDFHFDEDGFSQDYHQKFPLDLDFEWPIRFKQETPNQTLQRYLEIHHIDIQYEQYESLKAFLEEHVDLYGSKKLNLVGAYERMIDTMCCRLASVHLVCLSLINSFITILLIQYSNSLSRTSFTISSTMAFT